MYKTIFCQNETQLLKKMLIMRNILLELIIRLQTTCITYHAMPMWCFSSNITFYKFLTIKISVLSFKNARRDIISELSQLFLLSQSTEIYAISSLLSIYSCLQSYRKRYFNFDLVHKPAHWQYVIATYLNSLMFPYFKIK